VIVTNPPFGSKIPIRGSHFLEQFDLGHIWRKDEKNGWKMSEALRSSVPPEQLFIERCLQFLKPGGRLAIVLPDSILGNPGLGHIRQWLLKKTRIVASVDLHADTFQPRNGTQTSVLILQKKTQEEINEERYARQIAPYNIFMAMVEKVGHDKRGNTLFKRDRDGNEIWVSEERTSSVNYENFEGAIADIQTERKTRVIDDQSREVPRIFAQWKKEEGIPW
jgi:type I restriction enzyme M protein